MWAVLAWENVHLSHIDDSSWQRLTVNIYQERDRKGSPRWKIVVRPVGLVSAFCCLGDREVRIAQRYELRKQI